MRKTFFTLCLCFITLSSAACKDSGNPVIPPPVNNDGRVADYGLLYDNKICRWDIDAFPLSVYIDPAPASTGEFSPGMMAAAIDGIDMWDGVITNIPVLFTHVADFDSADIIVRWETIDLSGYTRATEYPDHIAIHKIALSDAIRDFVSLELIMGHELGHVLGLNLSGVSGDLMFSHVYPDKTTLTQRDIDMINWLYSQESYIPIRTY